MPKVKKSGLGGLLEWDEEVQADLADARRKARAKLKDAKKLPEKGQEALDKLLDEYDKLVDEEIES